MLNVNYGRNKDLMDKCKPLAEYAWFIDEIRNKQKNHDIGNSVKMAVESMPDDYVIKGFLMGHMKEGARRLVDVCSARTVMKWRRRYAGY